MMGGATVLQFTPGSLHTLTAISKDFKRESRYPIYQKCQAHSLWDFFQINFCLDHGNIKDFMHPILKELINNKIEKGCFSRAQ